LVKKLKLNKEEENYIIALEKLFFRLAVSLSKETANKLVGEGGFTGIGFSCYGDNLWFHDLFSVAI